MTQVPLFTGPNDIAALRAYLNQIVNYLNGSGIEFLGNVEIDGTLTVDGATTLTGAATLASTLGVTGAATLASTLGVTGATTLTSATLSSTLGVTGATTLTSATLSSTLGVTGAVTPTGGIAAAGGFTSSPKLCAIGGLVPAVSTDFTDATPVNTEFYYGAVFVPANCTVTGVAVFNGSDVTDNIKVGLASSAGVVLATSASTAGAGADAYQLVPFTAPLAVKGPATYFILSMYAASTSRYNAPPLGAFPAGKVTGQVFATGFTDFTPATTFTANLCNIASLY